MRPGAAEEVLAMPNLIGKIRTKAHDWVEGQRKKGAEDRDRAAKRKIQQREASGYYVLTWELPQGVQKRSLTSEVGVGVLKKTLASLGAADFKVSAVVIPMQSGWRGE
jgi:hypothetical protein